MTKKEQIIDMLEENGKMYVDDIADELSVQTVTVERYLRDLKHSHDLTISFDGDGYKQVELDTDVDADIDEFGYTDLDEDDFELFDEDFLDTVLQTIGVVPVKLYDVSNNFGKDEETMEYNLSNYVDFIKTNTITWVFQPAIKADYMEFKGSIFKNDDGIWTEIADDGNTKWEVVE